MKKNILGLFLLFLLTACQHLPSKINVQNLDTTAADSSQVVVVSAKQDMGPYKVSISRYERREGGWQAIGNPIDGVAGRNGIAPPGEKREGDGRTPSGVFPLERGFGYIPLETKIAYIVLTPEMVWIDDPKSPLYNRLITRTEAVGVSHEIMKRDDDLYKYGLVVEYNTKVIIPGDGSAIFFHIWGGPEKPTSGCVAMPEEAMIEILRWLDPSKKPVTIISSHNP